MFRLLAVVGLLLAAAAPALAKPAVDFQCVIPAANLATYNLETMLGNYGDNLKQNSTATWIFVPSGTLTFTVVGACATGYVQTSSSKNIKCAGGDSPVGTLTVELVCTKRDYCTLDSLPSDVAATFNTAYNTDFTYTGTKTAPGSYKSTNTALNENGVAVGSTASVGCMSTYTPVYENANVDYIYLSCAKNAVTSAYEMTVHGSCKPPCVDDLSAYWNSDIDATLVADKLKCSQYYTSSYILPYGKSCRVACKNGRSVPFSGSLDFTCGDNAKLTATAPICVSATSLNFTATSYVAGVGEALTVRVSMTPVDAVNSRVPIYAFNVNTNKDIVSNIIRYDAITKTAYTTLTLPAFTAIGQYPIYTYFEGDESLGLQDSQSPTVVVSVFGAKVTSDNFKLTTSLVKDSAALGDSFTITLTGPNTAVGTINYMVVDSTGSTVFSGTSTMTAGVSTKTVTASAIGSYTIVATYVPNSSPSAFARGSVSKQITIRPVGAATEKDLVNRFTGRR